MVIVTGLSLPSVSLSLHSYLHHQQLSLNSRKIACSACLLRGGAPNLEHRPTFIPTAQLCCASPFSLSPSPFSHFSCSSCSSHPKFVSSLVGRPATPAARDSPVRPLSLFVCSSSLTPNLFHSSLFMWPHNPNPLSFLYLLLFLRQTPPFSLRAPPRPRAGEGEGSDQSPAYSLCGAAHRGSDRGGAQWSEEHASFLQLYGHLSVPASSFVLPSPIRLIFRPPSCA